MNIAAYCRVSTDKADQLNSLEAQKEFFSEYTKRTGDTLVRLYADEGISETKIKNRKEFSNEQEEELEAITMDSGKTAAIFEAMKTTIGMDISPIDLINIESFANRVIHLFEYRKSLQEVRQNI